MSEGAAHIKLNFIDAILSIAETPQECHPKARYWLPVRNIDRLDVYCKINGLKMIESQGHFTKLLAGRIVEILPQKQW